MPALIPALVYTLLLFTNKISANTLACGNCVCKSWTLRQWVVHSVSFNKPACPSANAPVQIEQTVTCLSEQAFNQAKNSLSALKAILLTYSWSIPGTNTKSPCFKLASW